MSSSNKKLYTKAPGLSQKYYRDFTNDKENVGFPKKPTGKLQTDEQQLLRHKGLQEANQSSKHGAIPKTSKASGSASILKPIVHKSFSIYDESSYKDAKNDSNQKFITRRLREPKKLSVRFELPQPTGPSETDRLQISSNSQSSAVPRVSPRNLPRITQSNVSNIKVIHKDASVLRKVIPKDINDDLSMEAAYNLEYMTEYIRYQMEMSDKKILSRKFLKKSITPEQRRVIVTYLIKIATYHSYPSFVLYQTVKIFDFFIDTIDVPINELQVAALAAIWIALKKDMITHKIPEASSIIKLGGTLFEGRTKPLLEYEKKILMALKFELTFGDPFSMLALYTVTLARIRAVEFIDEKQFYYCCCYIIDLSLLLENTLRISAIHLAAISTEITLVATSGENLKNPQWRYWRRQVIEAIPIMEKYCLPDMHMDAVIDLLLYVAVSSENAFTDFHGVYKKYNTNRYGCVSKFLVSRISMLCANEHPNSACAKKLLF